MLSRRPSSFHTFSLYFRFRVSPGGHTNTHAHAVCHPVLQNRVVYLRRRWQIPVRSMLSSPRGNVPNCKLVEHIFHTVLLSAKLVGPFSFSSLGFRNVHCCRSPKPKTLPTIPNHRSVIWSWIITS